VNQWEKLLRLAAEGPCPDERGAEAFIAQAEKLVQAARENLRPRCTTPAKAELMRYPAKG
jgi:hypothetical protein